MKISIYQVDAFASKPFEGNPAAVCPLDQWLADDILQAIAEENNLSETAFFVPTQTGYHIRWFTPVSEVDLCGHATLASAHVLFHILGEPNDQIMFSSRSGILTVFKEKDALVLDFPAQPPVPCDPPAEIFDAFQPRPLGCFKAVDLLVVFEKESDIVAAAPDFNLLRQIDARGIIITAKSSTYDFVARFFAPSYGIPEDPVTGSAYTQLVPYWSQKTGKTKFKAKQVSKRGGYLTCKLKGDRVFIAGTAVMYMEGHIHFSFMMD